MKREEAINVIRSVLDTATTLIISNSTLRQLINKLMRSDHDPEKITVIDLDEWVRNITTTLEETDNEIKQIRVREEYPE